MSPTFISWIYPSFALATSPSPVIVSLASAFGISLCSWSCLSYISWCSRYSCKIFSVSTFLAANSSISFSLAVQIAFISAIAYSSWWARSANTNAEDDEAKCLSMRPNMQAYPIFFRRNSVYTSNSVHFLLSISHSNQKSSNFSYTCQTKKCNAFWIFNNWKKFKFNTYFYIYLQNILVQH